MLFTSGFIYVFVNNDLRAMKIKMVKKIRLQSLNVYAYDLRDKAVCGNIINQNG